METQAVRKNSKHLALIFLIIMAAGFIITIPFENSFWGKFLQGGFEAGLVGGLADWFAVTALFRHPLGLPIPHTALLPKNREKMTKGLISTMENNWLTKESIISKLKSVRIVEKVFDLLERELYSAMVKSTVEGFAVKTVQQFKSEKWVPVIEKEIKTYVSGLNTSAAFESLIDQISSRNYDEKTIDYALGEAERWLVKEESGIKLGRTAIQMMDRIEGDGFVRFAINSFTKMVNEDKIGHIIQNYLLQWIQGMKRDESKKREILLDPLRERLEKLKVNEGVKTELESWKSKLLTEYQMSGTIDKVLEHFRRKALEFVEGPDFYSVYAGPIFERLLRQWREEEEKTSRLEIWVQTSISAFIDKNHSKIGMLVKENIDKLDNEKLIDLIENNVGRDLQWIRVNGAVCGFVIGIILTIIRMLL